MGARRLGLLKGAAAAVICMTAAAAVSDSAEARHRRDMCFAKDRYGRVSAEARGRQMGERNGRMLFQRIWNRVDRNCAQLDRVANIIAETPLRAPRMGSGFTACFAQGYVEALFDQLDQAYLRCGDACYSAGAEIGNISAQGYCAVSMALGGLDDPGFIRQPALPFCGENLAIGCKTEYLQAATYEIQGCSYYTEGRFERIFDNTVRQDCFVPSDVPIRDGYLSFLDSYNNNSTLF